MEVLGAHTYTCETNIHMTGRKNWLTLKYVVNLEVSIWMLKKLVRVCGL
jgi:hypothetical protein